MVFVRPGLLWLLILALPLVALHFNRRSGLRPARAVIVTTLRTLAFVLLVFAMARPVIEHRDPGRTVVAVVDLSASMTEADLETIRASLQKLAAARQSHETLRLVAFGPTAREIALTEQVFAPGALASLRRAVVANGTAAPPAPSPGSAMADALELAGALIPHDGRGHVVVYTDGLQTGGDAEAAARRLAERGIGVTAEPVGATRPDEVVLRSVSMPPAAGVGARVELRAEVEASRATEGRLIISPLPNEAAPPDNTRAPAGPPAEEIVIPIALRPGRQTVACLCPLHKEGLAHYSVRVESAVDTLPDNNTLSAAIRVEPPQNVLVLEDNPAAPAAAALAALLGEAATVKSADLADFAEAERAVAALSAADLLVVADTPAENISPQTQQQIRDAVTGGMGLIVTGGRRVFGPGGYANTPLADVLPVKFPQKVERRDPSATLVVIIDTSGSMGGPRVNLAKEIARLAIARLKPHDKVGIVEFYGSKRWAAPIQPASNAIDLQRALNRLSASGGTVILPAIEEAYYALLNVRTRTKHVLVLTDGGVEPGAFEPLIRKMADAGITVSTVLVGPGTESAFLASLAQWGRGRFYSAPDRFNLPEVIVKQNESSLLNPFVEQPSAIRIRMEDVITDGIDFAAAPPLRGYVETEIRPTADLLLVSDLGHPILAVWRYGLGRTAAFTPEISGEWSRALARWAPYAKLFSNLVRSLSGPRAEQALRLQPIIRPGAVEIRIDNRIAHAGEAAAALELTVTGPDGSTRRLTADPIRPDQWNVRITDLPPGTYRLDARTSSGRLRGAAALVVPPIREVSALGPDRPMLDELNRMQRDAERAAATISTPPIRPRELWPAMTAAALVIFLLNVLIRRLPALPYRFVVPARTAGAIVLLSLSIQAIPEAAPARADATAASPATKPAAATRTAETQQSPASLPPPPDAIRAINEALACRDAACREQQFGEACRLTLLRDGFLDSLAAYLQSRSAGNPMVARLLADVAREQGDLVLARRTLTDLAASGHADIEIWSELARIEEELGNDPAALAALDRAIAAQPEPDQLFALRVRQALILLDGPDPAAGTRALRAIVESRPNDPAVANYCAYLASFAGENALALDLLTPTGGAKEQVHEHLFRGLFLLRLNRPDAAEKEFEQAYAKASLDRDRRFALERVITSARRAGHLKSLADAWLADPRLPADRLGALVAILRELGRADDALRLLRRPAQTPEQGRLVESAEFQRELIAVAVEAGRTGEAEASYRAMLNEAPDRIEWRIGLARLKLLEGKREEAVGLFQDATAQSEDPGYLMLVADGARQLALDEAALAAARKAGARGGIAHVRAVLFEADLSRQRGRTDRALALLKQLNPATVQDPKALSLVAEAFERYGDKAEALRLFQQLYAIAQGEDTLLRIAWLLEEDQRFDEAYALWKDMWQTTSVPARQRQSQDRMLDLAARTGKLADLAIELEERIAEGNADDRTLSLLVHIYTKANDPVSAAEILQDFARRSGNQVEALKRLARVYLDCEQFGRCNAVLRRLAVLDPANRVDYWQQIAMMALERRQPQQAKAALAKLTALAAGDEVVDEFSAGVLDMTGLHEEAAAAYGRALARHPDRIEALLLWGRAMRDAGQADRAVARFQNLIEDAVEDDLFTVAVDGLLNLSARPAAMRSALRRVYARIAAKPDKVFLYQLGADLLESLGRTRPMRDLMEQAVVVAGERRGPLLRELMDGAKTDGLNDRVIQYGQSLLGLGEEQPPQVFLDLGEAMFKEHDLALAERVFERAAVESDFSAIRQRVATYYEEANMPAVADRIIRELLGTEPDNVPLLIRSGALCEQLGAFARAFEQYDRAADLMLRRLPGSVRPDESGRARGRERPSRRAERTGRATNLDEMARFFRSAANGLRSAARTPALRERLLATLSARIEEELKTLAAEKSLMPTIEGNPRLDNLAWFLREVAFSFHNPDAADRIDRRLLDLYPKDAGLRTTVVRERLDWGLYARAAALASDAPPDWAAPTTITADALLSDKAALENAIAKGAIPLSLATRLVPGLLMTGRDEEARRVLRATPTRYAPDVEADLSAAAPSVVYSRGDDRGAMVFVEAASTMAALSIGLEEHDTLRAWTNAWIEACSKMRSGSAIVTSLKRCMSVVWNALSAEERTAFADRLNRLADATEGEKRLHVNLLRLQLADRLAIPFDGLDRILQEAPEDKTLDADDLAELLQRAPADARPGLLKRIVDAREPARKRAVLFGIAANLKPAVDEALMQSFETLLKAAPRQRRDLDEDSSFEGGWVRGRAQPELARRLAEVLLSESPNDPAVMVAAAAARDNVGLHDEAMPLAKEAIEALLNVKKPTSEHARLIAEAARIMRPDEIRATIADLDERQQIEGPSAMRSLVKAVLVDAAGDKAEAIAAYRSAFEMQPGERIFVSKLISALKQSGRSVELARLLATHLRKSSIMETYEWYTLVTLYCELFDPLKAMQAAQKIETVQGPVEVMRIARSMGRTEDILTTFRRLYTKNRDSGRFYSPAWPAPPSPGGMLGYLARLQDRGWGRAFSALADLPFAQEEFTALLLAAPPQQGDVLALIDGLLRATRLNNSRPALVDSLADAWQRQALTDKDRRMIVALAKEDPANITDALLPALEDIVLHTPPGDAATLTTLARVYRARGSPDRARRILRWVVISDMRSGRAGGSERFSRMEEYLAALPDNERAAARRKLLAGLEPTPLDEPTDAFDSEWLTCWAAAGEPAELNRRVEMIRKRIESAEAEATPRLLAATLARFDAEAGRFEAFKTMVACACRGLREESLNVQVFDCRALLPPANRMKDPARYVDAVVAALEAPRTDGTLSQAGVTHLLCLVGDWCVENSLREKAEAILQRAREQAGPPGEHWLWIADLARLSGASAVAVELETKLLEADLLPVVRVPALLDAVEAARGREAADKLAIRVATYSDHPVVLKRAIRQSRAAGDLAAANRYEERLQKVSAASSEASPPAATSGPATRP